MIFLQCGMLQQQENHMFLCRTLIKLTFYKIRLLFQFSDMHFAPMPTSTASCLYKLVSLVPIFNNFKEDVAFFIVSLLLTMLIKEQSNSNSVPFKNSTTGWSVWKPRRYLFIFPATYSTTFLICLVCVDLNCLQKHLK